jgi:hypothetical protein
LVCTCPPADLSFVEADGVADRLLLAFKLEVPVASDFCRHFVNKALGSIALTPDLLGVSPHEQLEDPGRLEMVGEINRFVT